MTVYIEWVFLENFALDFLLLRLALRMGRERVSGTKLALGAFAGGAFAVLYPLLSLPIWCQAMVKCFVGACMCALAFERIKTKNEWGRYAFTTLCFFIISFAFAGALTFFHTNSFYIFVGFGWLCMGAEFCVKRLYKKRRQAQFLYDCTVYYKEKTLQLTGFYDTGNAARYQGVPVCFLSADAFYRLLGWEILEDRGQVCDEIVVSTVNGKKRTTVYAGKICIEGKEKCVYFALASHIVNKAYNVLLNGRIFDDEDGEL